MFLFLGWNRRRSDLSRGLGCNQYISSRELRRRIRKTRELCWTRKSRELPGPMKQQHKKSFLQTPVTPIKTPSTKEMAEDQPKDECDVFEAHVACQIRNLPSTFYQVTAKHRINQVLYDL